MRHALVAPVDRQRVLHEVVRADAEKLHLRRDQVRRQRGRRDFDHRADFDVGIEIRARGGQFRLALFQDRVGLVHLRRAADHRIHDPQPGIERGRPQQGPQLGLEQRRPVQAQADGAPPQERIVLRRQLARGRDLVAAEIEGADDGRLGPDPAGHFGIGFVLALLARLAAGAHEQVFAAEQADAAGAARLRGLHVRGHLDVRRQIHGVAVERDGRLVPQRAEALLDGRAAARKPVVVRFAPRRGMRHQQAADAVEHDAVAVGQPGGRPAHAHDGRQVHRARHDGHVRRGAAALGHHAQHLAAVERRHFRRRDVVRDEDARGFEAGEPFAAARQVAQDAPGHVADVGGPFAEIVVFHFPQRAGIALGHVEHGLFDVPAPLAQVAVDLVDEAGVVHHLQVRLENPGAFAAEGFADAPLDVVQLAAGFDQGGFEAQHFARHVRGVHGVFRQRLVVRLQEQDGAGDDARRGSDPPHLELLPGLHGRLLSLRRTSVRTGPPARRSRPPRRRRRRGSSAWRRGCPPASAGP